MGRCDRGAHEGQHHHFRSQIIRIAKRGISSPPAPPERRLVAGNILIYSGEPGWEMLMISPGTPSPLIGPLIGQTGHLSVSAINQSIAPFVTFAGNFVLPTSASASTTHAPGVLRVLQVSSFLLSNSKPLEPSSPRTPRAPEPLEPPSPSSPPSLIFPTNPNLSTSRDLHRTTISNARTPPVTYTANSVALQAISKGSSTKSRPHLALQNRLLFSHSRSLIMSPAAKRLPRITLP